MPLEGDTKFKVLKKNYAGGSELRGKTMGVIGFGRIGQETAKIALGVGMNVVAHDPFLDTADLKVVLGNGAEVDVAIEMNSFESVLKEQILSACMFLRKTNPLLERKNWL